MGHTRSEVPTPAHDPVGYNEMINVHVQDIMTNEARGAWREYAKIIKEEHVVAVRNRLANPSYRGKLVELFNEQLSAMSANGNALPWTGGGVEKFIKACIGYFGLPSPPNQEVAFALLLRRFRAKSSEDPDETLVAARKGSDAMVLSEAEALLMIDTMARILLRLYNLQEGTAMVNASVAKMMDSPAFAQFLKNLNVDNAALAASKFKDHASDLAWVEPIFCQADVGKAQLLSFETRQVHFFFGQVLEFLSISSSQLSDGAATGEGPSLFDDKMMESLARGFVMVDSDFIDRLSCDHLISTFLTALAIALQT